MNVLINGVKYAPFQNINNEMPNSFNSFGDALKFCRKNANLTLEEAAKNCRSSKSHIWGIEKNKCEPGVGLFKRLCIAYDVNAAFLIKEWR
jgi:transcriptional regulator with XRE-family HTH domain